ncbi:MAG: hypothetical protein HYR84_10065 [Planctomycetes bacterium]|nr:hypothetical protein [Planctomycetota bacterium]
MPDTTAIRWSIQYVTTGSLTIPSARLEVEVFLRSALPGCQLICEQAWIDTGAPLSVIPFQVHHARLAWKRVPGVQLSWAGQVCDLGMIDFWLATQESPALRGPFNLLAKFARSDPLGSLMPVLLGLEFFASNQATMSLLPPGQPSTVSLP